MFDEQPDGDIHGECSAEIDRLLAALKRAAFVLADVPNQDARMLAVRTQIVEEIKRADPAYYGLPANRAPNPAAKWEYD